MKILYVSLVIVIIDQVSKLLVKGFKIPFLSIEHRGMELYQTRSVIGDFFRLTYIENPGMAFGINFGDGSKFLLTFFSILASIGIIYYLYKNRNHLFITRFSLALILGGAIGNLIDRIFYGVLYGEGALFHGKVVDFFDFDFFNVNVFGHQYDRWPIFNIADMSVSIGVLLLLIFYGKISKHEEKIQSAKTLAENSNADLLPQNIDSSNDVYSEVVDKENLSIQDGNNNGEKS